MRQVSITRKRFELRTNCFDQMDICKILSCSSETVSEIDFAIFENVEADQIDIININAPHNSKLLEIVKT